MSANTALDAFAEKKENILEIKSFLLYFISIETKVQKVKIRKVIYVTVICLTVWLSWGLAPMTLTGNPGTDVGIKDIVVGSKGFIYIELENLGDDIPLQAEWQEKVFLTIYINNLKRAEYKLKYIDATLFKKQGKLLFPTNFRVPQKLEIKAVINEPPLFSETDVTNNELSKQLATQSL